MDLTRHEAAFHRFGWFIPPYLQLGFLTNIVDAIEGGHTTSQEHLEGWLALAYTPLHLSAMLCDRYSITPFIQDYKAIIGEAIEAHCWGLDHVAVAGLLPVIEGAASKIAASRGLAPGLSIRDLFTQLAANCKEQVVTEKIGNVSELATMFDSFQDFAVDYLYTHSTAYSLSDKTNRHGTLHGTYSDSDYGKPINFFKVIASVDFLCIVSALRSNLSWLAPDPTLVSMGLSTYLIACSAFRRARPSI